MLEAFTRRLLSRCSSIVQASAVPASQHKIAQPNIKFRGQLLPKIEWKRMDGDD